jgi:hypothetical protein
MAGKEREVALLQAQVSEVQAKLARRQAELEALRTALDMVRDGPQRLTPGGRPWPQLTRSGAVERILKEEGRALSPREISLALGQRGRDGDGPSLVSASLNHLAKMGRAHKPQPARWRAGPSDLVDAGLGPEPSGLAAGQDQIGEPAGDYKPPRQPELPGSTAHISISPTEVPAGAVAEVSLSGWRPEVPVELHLGTPTGKVIGTVETSSAGSASGRIKVPSKLEAGTYNIYAVGGEDQAGATFAVNPAGESPP